VLEVYTYTIYATSYIKSTVTYRDTDSFSEYVCTVVSSVNQSQELER